jgi:cytochrome c oxidase cbb3-type subunit III
VHKLLVFLLFVGVALAQNEPHAGAEVKNPFGGDPQAVAAGAQLFQTHCASCHGSKGEGGSGPDLSQGTFGVGDGDDDLRQIVTRGREVMPGFRNTLEEDDIWRVISFIRSLAGQNLGPVTGDAAAGATLFWGKGGCGQCHRVGLQGGGAGPNLTKIGVRRGTTSLRNSITTPDAEVPRGYAVVTAVTMDGKTVQGIEVRHDAFSAQFRDLANNYYSYLRSEVKEMSRSEKSLMPSYASVFSDKEVDDLVAYLAGLGRGDKR